jgi:hypothetical protein
VPCRARISAQLFQSLSMPEEPALENVHEYVHLGEPGERLTIIRIPVGAAYWKQPESLPPQAERADSSSLSFASRIHQDRD